MNLQKNLKWLRDQHKYTQHSIAVRLRIADNLYQYYETRANEVPVDVLMKLAALYKLTMHALCFCDLQMQEEVQQISEQELIAQYRKKPIHIQQMIYSLLSYKC